MTRALFELTMKPDADGSRRVYHPYAIWHNQKTNTVTVQTETGYYKHPADAIEKIEILQLSLFTQEEPVADAAQQEKVSESAQ